MSDEEIAQREQEEREQQQIAPRPASRTRQRASRVESTPVSGDTAQVLAEVRKVRQLVGWLVMLIAVQFSIGFSVGVYLSLSDRAEDDGALLAGSGILGLVLIGVFGYLIFRPPTESS